MKYDRLWQNTPEDLRTLELYEKISKTVMQPGMAKVVEQPLIEVPEDTKKEKTILIDPPDFIDHCVLCYGIFFTGIYIYKSYKS